MCWYWYIWRNTNMHHLVPWLSSKTLINSVYSNCRQYSNKAASNFKSILKLDQYIKPSGTLKVSLPYAVQIVTLDPKLHPMMDKIMVEVHGFGSLEMSDIDIQDLCHINSKDGQVILSCNDHLKFKRNCIACRIDIPIKYDLNVNTTGRSDISLESIECSRCDVCTEQGSIICSKLKTENFQAKTDGGHILCSGTILGDIHLDTKKNGSIQTEKLQGKLITLKTEDGSVNVKSMYAEKSQIFSKKGNIKLANVHGNTDIVTRDGNVHAQGVDGSLNIRAEKADISVHVSKLDNLSVETDSGDVDVFLPENTTAKIHVEGSQVAIADDLHFTGETGPLLQQWTGKVGMSDQTDGKIYVVTDNGEVCVKTLDWFSSLDLKKISPESE